MTGLGVTCAPSAHPYAGAAPAQHTAALAELPRSPDVSSDMPAAIGALLTLRATNARC